MKAAKGKSRKRPGTIKLSVVLDLGWDSQLYAIAKQLDTTKAALAAKLIQQGLMRFKVDNGQAAPAA